MAKKLLNEAVVRRFQSLANIRPINEMSYKRDEKEEMEEVKHGDEDKEKMEEAEHGDEDKEKMEETYMEAEDDKEKMEETYMEQDEDPADDMEMDMAGGEDVDLTDEEAELLIALGKKLEMAMGDEEPEMDMAGDDMPGDDMPGEKEMMEEDELMETLSEIDYVPSQNEIVNEVARRVARRLAEAQKAEKRMNEALGRK